MGPVKLLLTPVAERHFRSLLENLGEHSGWERSLLVEEQLYAAFRELAAHPNLGHTRPELLAAPMLFYYVAPYMILYVRYPALLEVVGLYHGAQDIAALHG